MLDVRLGDRGPTPWTVEVGPEPSVEEALVEEVYEDRLTHPPVVGGVGLIVLFIIVRGEPNPFRQVHIDPGTRLHLLPAESYELLSVELVKTLVVLLLDSAFDVDAVPVQSKGEEDLISPHPHGPRDHVYEGVVSHCSDVPAGLP